jgi:hypothetical protein
MGGGLDRAQRPLAGRDGHADHLEQLALSDSLAREVGVKLKGAVDQLHVSGMLEAIQRQMQPVVHQPAVRADDV